MSPPLTPDGELLADGDYAATADWPDDPTQPLQLELQRFEQCALLAEEWPVTRVYSCEPRPEGEDFLPGELGIDESVSRPLTVVLDDTARVVMVGWDPTIESDEKVVEQATGTELAELANELDRAYENVFASRYLAGKDPDAIVADVVADPTGGFVPAPNAGDLALVFVPTAGPTVLFQAVFWDDSGERVVGRGTDALKIKSIEVVDGQVTLHVYASYVS
ncbi:MAG: hypothetical protein WEB78_06035 [Ilumatobacteraceae bacterium]